MDPEFSNPGDFAISDVELRVALQAIAADDKRDLLTALERVPQLVAMETNPTKFLLRESFDTTKAIKRLALYWKYRVEVFGPDRAFRPMTLCGDGALSCEDVAAFRLGAYRHLPGPVPAMFCDVEVANSLPTETIDHLNFYYMQVRAPAILSGFHFCFTSCYFIAC